jgi:hypothetical protein
LGDVDQRRIAGHLHHPVADGGYDRAVRERELRGERVRHRAAHRGEGAGDAGQHAGAQLQWRAHQ